MATAGPFAAVDLGQNLPFSFQARDMTAHKVLRSPAFRGGNAFNSSLGSKNGPPQNLRRAKFFGRRQFLTKMKKMAGRGVEQRGPGSSGRFPFVIARLVRATRPKAVRYQLWRVLWAGWPAEAGHDEGGDGA
jgi:hypothetical protein